MRLSGEEFTGVRTLTGRLLCARCGALAQWVASGAANNTVAVDAAASMAPCAAPLSLAGIPLLRKREPCDLSDDPVDAPACAQRRYAALHAKPLLHAYCKDEAVWYRRGARAAACGAARPRGPRAQARPPGPPEHLGAGHRDVAVHARSQVHLKLSRGECWPCLFLPQIFRHFRLSLPRKTPGTERSKPLVVVRTSVRDPSPAAGSRTKE